MATFDGRYYTKIKMIRGHDYTATAFFDFMGDAIRYLSKKKTENKKLRGYVESYHYDDARVKSLYVVYTRRVK